MGFHGYFFGMDAITNATTLESSFVPKIRPFRSVSCMSFPSFLRTSLKASVSSFWEGRCCSFGVFAFGRCPDAGADRLAGTDADEAAETESVDAMMKPDAGEARWG